MRRVCVKISTATSFKLAWVGMGRSLSIIGEGGLGAAVAVTLRFARRLFVCTDGEGREEQGDTI